MKCPPEIQLIIDHIRDGSKDNSLVALPALDLQQGIEVWLLGRKIDNERIWPVALFLTDSAETIKRYQPREKS